MKPVSPNWLNPRPHLWVHIFDWGGPGDDKVTLRVISFAIFAELVWFIDWVTPVEIDLGVAVAPYEFAGTILGALLVLRTNSGLERWWEARKLWGGITNQSRNLATIAIANGPDDPGWRREFIGWIIAFAHVTRRSLRGEPGVKEEVLAMVGAEQAGWIAEAQHMPTAVSLKIADLLRNARDRGLLDSSAFLKAEDQRGGLIDHLGGCERILKTPLASSYVILIRRFIILFLTTLPFALLRRVEWQTPLVTLLVAYPILALDHIADDLQHPFSTARIDHLPLDEITSNIEANLLALLPQSALNEASDSRSRGLSS
jgi:ion channel-forming bestrophin family protein